MDRPLPLLAITYVIERITSTIHEAIHATFERNIPLHLLCYIKKIILQDPILFKY